MLYEIGIKYTGDKEHDAQIKIPNIPISVDRRKFWFGGRSIPHWNEDESTAWVKVPVLQKGITKIYVDDSASKDLSNINTFKNTISGVTGAWQLNEGSGTTAVDSSGNGNTGTLTGCTWVDSPFEKALYFNGSSYVTTTYPGILGTAERTVMAWVKFTASGVLAIITWGPNTTDNRTTLAVDDNTVAMLISGANIYYTGNNVNDGNWHHIAAVMPVSGTLDDVKIYQDGILLTAVSSSYHSTDTYNTLQSPNVTFGREPSSNTSYYIGNIDIPLIFNRTLTSDEIAQLANNYSYTSSNYPGYVLLATKYVVSPVIAYIKPYHKWWLFAQQGGIIKEFFAGVFEKITHVQDDISSTQESITHELSNRASTQEDITQSRSSTVSNEELITQNSESISSANEQITQTLTVAVNSLEQIIKEYDFKASNLEQISNTKDGKASSFEAITQDNEVITNTEENIINEYDFVASALESIKNDITSKAGVIEENTQLKETIISTCEQMMNIFEFHASTLESIRNQIESIVGTQESIANQATVEASTNEQMMNIYEFFGGAVEEIQKSVQSLASVSEKIANGNIALASALEEIEQIVVGARPIFARTITEIKKLKSKIEEVL